MEPESPAPPAARTAADNGGAPPASFDFLVNTLFTQALMALGRIPNPITKQPLKNLAAARHFTDMLGVLEVKTAGNLSADERRLLDEVQHQLRMQLLAEQEQDQPTARPGSASS